MRAEAELLCEHDRRLNMIRQDQARPAHRAAEYFNSTHFGVMGLLIDQLVHRAHIDLNHAQHEDVHFGGLAMMLMLGSCPLKLHVHHHRAVMY
jgi:hypothetical protein